MKNLLLLLLLLLLAIVLLSGCSNHKTENRHVEVSQYLCVNNGGWQNLKIFPFNERDVQCFDGSSYGIRYHSNHQFYYIKGNMNEDINKKINSIMGGTERNEQ